METIKVGSDFSGVGAFDQALRRLNIPYETTFACDMDKYARETYISNYGEPKYFPKNVYDRTVPLESLDIYMTSPPCQAFSMAGKRKGESDKRGVLFYSSHEFIKVNRPRYFIFENVKGLLSDDKGRTFQRWIDFLARTVNGQPLIFPHEQSVMYHVYYRVLNSKDFGVPQNRERVFIVGIRDDQDNHFRFPKKEYLTTRLKDILEEDVDKKYFLSEKMLNFIQNTTFRQSQQQSINTAARCQIVGGDVTCIDINETNQKPPETPYILSTHNKSTSDLANTLGTNSQCSTAKSGQLLITLNEKSHDAEEVMVGSTIIEESDGVQMTMLSHRSSNMTKRTQNRDVAWTLEASGGKMAIEDPSLKRLPDLTIVGTKRVNETPKEINAYLKAHKDKLKGTIGDVAMSLGIPHTQAEHYFRVDKYRTIPSPEIWLKLKELLGFDDAFDKEVTEIFEKESQFDSQKRLYSADGISKTLDTMDNQYYEVDKTPKKWVADFRNDEGLRIRRDGNSPTLTSHGSTDGGVAIPWVGDYTNDTKLKFLGGTNTHYKGDGTKSRHYSKSERVYDSTGLGETLTTQTMGSYKVDTNIRRLTPRECFRLQDFPEDFIMPCSDTQMYRQAGNSITVGVLEKLINKLNLTKT